MKCVCLFLLGFDMLTILNDIYFKVLGKSIKPIPVMILGVFLARKRYPLLKYLFVLMIVMGVALFMYKPKSSHKSLDQDHVLGFGEVLLVRYFH